MNGLIAPTLLAAQHIFIIDDCELITTFLDIRLSKMGYTTYVYQNGHDFLNDIPDVSPSILITDMNMPEVTGIELQKELARLNHTMPVILMSGESTIPQYITAIEQGAIAFLLKPLDKEQLKAVVASAFKEEAQRLLSANNMHALALKLNTLSPRERATYKLLILSYNNAELAESLNLSLSTIKQYKAEVMRKLQATTLAELINL